VEKLATFSPLCWRGFKTIGMLPAIVLLALSSDHAMNQSDCRNLLNYNGKLFQQKKCEQKMWLLTYLRWSLP